MSRRITAPSEMNSRDTDELFPRDDYLVGEDDDFDALLRDGADFHDIRNRLRNNSVLDETHLQLVEELITNRESTKLPVLLYSDFNAAEKKGYQQNAVKQCAKHGWLHGLKYLRANGVPVLWAPMFASMRGHTDILEWIEKTTTYLESVTVAMECVSYGIEVGCNPEAAIWLLERQYIDPKFVMQSAIRKGDTTLLDEIYRYLEKTIDKGFLQEVLKDAFPYIWINAVGAPKKLLATVEYLVAVSDMHLETEWHRQVFQRNKKRMRLAKVLGNWTAPSEGMKRKLAGWCDKSDQDKHTFLETLMESQTDTRLTHVADLVDEFLIGELQQPDEDLSPPELDHLSSISG